MENKKYVIFALGAEKYGIDIDAVNSIDECQEIRKIPNMPSHFEGIINFRGAIVPIVNLKKKFNIQEDTSSRLNSKMIMTNTDRGMMGFLVDEASIIVEINEDDIEPASNVIVGFTDKTYISGIGKLDGEIVSIIDLERAIAC